MPLEKRVLRGFDFFVLWFSLGVGLLVIQAGVLLTAPFGSGLSLTEALFVIVVGSVVGSLMLGASGLIGSRYGVPSMVSLRPVLGRTGSYVPTVLNVLQLVGWTSFEILIMAEAATLLLGEKAGSAVNFVFLVVFGFVCGLLALGGPLVVVRRWLSRLGIWLVIGSTAFITFFILVAPPAGGWGGFTSPSLNLLGGLDLVIAMPISWWPLLSDYSRFATNGRSAATGTILGYIPANVWFFFLGAAAVVLLGQFSAAGAILATGVGGLALLFILVDETDNGFANIYSTAVSAQNLRPRLPQRWLVVGAMAVGIVLAGVLTATGGLNAALSYEFFLLLVGGFFVPLLGVVTADWFVVRRGQYDPAEFREASPALRLAPFVAWVAGIAVYFGVNGILFFQIAPVLPAIGGSLPAFAVAAGLHALISRVASPSPRVATGG